MAEISPNGAAYCTLPDCLWHGHENDLVVPDTDEPTPAEYDYELPLDWALQPPNKNADRS